MKYLIIPDVHLKIDRVEKIIATHEFDVLISLGDWFDDFNDTVEDNRKTAEFILRLYKEYGENFIWLLGNHDIPYVYPEVSRSYWCSGNTPEKAKAIAKVFNRKLNKALLKLSYIVKFKKHKPIVFSHAGIHVVQFKENLYLAGIPDITTDKISLKCEQVLLNCELGRPDTFLSAGPARYGYAPIGGITWLDWNMEFAPVKGLSQIVGHTPNIRPMMTDGESDVEAIEELSEKTKHVLEAKKCYNINLDTHLNHYAILDNKELTIYRYK